MKSISSPLIAAAVLMTLAGTARAQILNPISFSFSSGTTGDGIVGPAPNNTTANLTIDGSAFYLAEKGQDPSNPSLGIPDGAFLSASNGPTKTATFQFQPAAGTNILKGSGTLTLTTPETFSAVGFLVQSLGGANPVTFTLNFAGGATETFTTATAVPYWVGGNPTASGGTVALGPVAAIYQKSGGYNLSGLDFDEYDYRLAPADQGLLLDSISINANGESLVTYGFSATPEPSTWTMMVLGVLALAWRLRRKRAPVQA